jgi:hypothetical protein
MEEMSAGSPAPLSATWIAAPLVFIRTLAHSLEYRASISSFHHSEICSRLRNRTLRIRINKLRRAPKSALDEALTAFERAWVASALDRAPGLPAQDEVRRRLSSEVAT